MQQLLHRRESVYDVEKSGLGCLSRGMAVFVDKEVGRVQNPEFGASDDRKWA